MATFQVSMKTDDRAVQLAFRDWERHISEAGEKTARELEKIGSSTAHALAPVGPAGGHHDGERPILRSNIKTKWTGSKSFWITIDAINVMSQETGAGGHVITGNPYLHFFWEAAGEWVKTTSVEHPGNPAVRFMEAAFAAMDGAVDSIADRNYP
jgi:hypothetical protein